MAKKVALWILALAVLVGVEGSAGQQGNAAPGERPMLGPRGGFGGAAQGMRAGFDTWFNELTKAHEQNDREKVGQLLEDMKQRRQRFRGALGGPDRGGPPEGMGRGGRPMGPGSGRFAAGGSGTSLMESPLPKTDAEKKILEVLDDMNRNQRRGMMNVPQEDGRWLRLLTEAAGAKHVVEIGTSNGYSGIWFCLALQKTGGKLTTHEIDARRASLARENFKRAGLDKLVTLVEGDAHETIKNLKEPIDILFLDADKEGYIDYLNRLLPLVRPGGLVLAHNISPRQSDPRYIEAITRNPDLETLLTGTSIGVTLKKR